MCVGNTVTLDHDDQDLTEWFSAANASFIKSIVRKSMWLKKCLKKGKKKKMCIQQ